MLSINIIDILKCKIDYLTYYVNMIHELIEGFCLPVRLILNEIRISLGSSSVYILVDVQLRRVWV